MSMTTKGVRAGPHPKWHQKAMDIENDLIRKIDSRIGVAGRDKTRPGPLWLGKAIQGKENPMKKRPVGRPRKKKKNNDPEPKPKDFGGPDKIRGACIGLPPPEWYWPWKKAYELWEKGEKWLPPERHWPPRLRHRVGKVVVLRNIDPETSNMLNQLVDDGYRVTNMSLLMAFRRGACWLEDYLRKQGKREEHYRSVMW